MKLKILPTHLRDKKRYLAFQAFSEIPLQREDVISLVTESSGNLYGSCGTSKLGLWVVKVWNYPVTGNDYPTTGKSNSVTGNDYPTTGNSYSATANNYPATGRHVVKGIIRCKRDEVDRARAVIPTITKFHGKKVVFQTLGISGTIKAAITNFIKLKAADE
nr:Rpp14/Pop5 family protein [uncultured Methanobacterium sp.]